MLFPPSGYFQTPNAYKGLGLSCLSPRSNNPSEEEHLLLDILPSIIMSSVHYQQAICPTAINSLNGYEPTFNSPGLWDGSQHVLSSNKEAAEHDGCFACRWRKKRCRHGQYGLPSPDSPCTDCKRFHILCFGAGQERPTVRTSTFSPPLSLSIPDVFII